MRIQDFIGEAIEYDKKQMLEEKRPKSWCKSVSSFANRAGGILIFGIADDDSIVGLADSKHDSEIISEQIKTKLDPIPKFDLSLQRIDGDKELIILKIFSGNETPYYYIGDGNRIAYHRVGNQSIPADARILKELVYVGVILPMIVMFQNTILINFPSQS